MKQTIFPYPHRRHALAKLINYHECLTNYVNTCVCRNFHLTVDKSALDTHRYIGYKTNNVIRLELQINEC